MRVTHVVCTSDFAGVERHVAVLATAQHDAGHEVTVLGGNPERMRAAINRSAVTVLRSPDLHSAMRHLAGAPGRAADVVATHMTGADLAALASPTLARTPLVSTRHFASRRGATRPRRAITERAQRRLTVEIAVSEYIAGAIGADATVVLPGILDRPDGAPPSARAATVLVAQRLEPEKSTDTALRAFAEAGLVDRGWRLLIAGDGSQRPALEALARDLGIDGSTDFLGHRHDIEDLMGSAAICLAPCAVEGLGLSVVEAMASGTPVVAAAAGGHLESAGAVTDAALFAPGDTGGAGRLLADLADDPGRLDAYGLALRERQRSTFSVTAQAAATDEVYRYAIASRRRLPQVGGGPVRGLVVVSLEPWDHVWRRNQHLLSGLLRDDPSLRVLVVEPDVDPLHAARRGAAPRAGRGLRRGPHLRGVDPDALWLLEPTKLFPRRLDPRQDDRWADTVRETADVLDLGRPTLWVNDPRGALIMQRTSWPTLYDITDDWLQADRDAATLDRLRAQEGALMEGSREVVVCSTSLADTKSTHRPVTLVHNAVDVAATARPAARPSDLPEGATAVYVGTLHADRLDVALCEATARAVAGSGTVVLVGPDALTAEERERLDTAGVVRLGARDRRAVPGYLQHADVLLVPHVVDDFTDSLDPIKLYEYRAVGRPVVSTPVAGFRDAASERLRVVAPSAFAPTVAGLLPATDRYPTGMDHDVPTWADRVAQMRAVLDRVALGSHADLPTTAVPLGVRVRLGHAAVQHLADEHGVDLLHIKGDALDDQLVHPGRQSTDADVLVRPAHVDRLVAACSAAGYRATGRFATSSPFEHAISLWHDHWGYLDVHRHYPGIGLPTDVAFERLWSDRGHREIASVSCPTPSLPAQAAILVMHAGRNLRGGQPSADVHHVWHDADPSFRQEVRDWVVEMRAEVAFAAGIGELDALPASHERDLWAAVTSEGRVNEWRARIAAAPDLRSRLRLVLRAPLVNTDHLATQLGHRPSRTEVAVDFVSRVRRGLDEVSRRGRSS